jgi:SAM-dependent methyltransferase
MTAWLGNKLPQLLEQRLVCTRCGAPLSSSVSAYRCFPCDRLFPVENSIPRFWDGDDEFKLNEADFYGRESENPSLASLVRNFYRSTGYDRKHAELDTRFLRPEDVVLSLGGGDGRHGLDLCTAGHIVLESDLAVGSARVAGRNFAAANVDRPWAVAAIDAEDIPFAPATFDAVYICAALHQMPNRNKVAAGIKRVLKPGGHLIIISEPASWFYKVLRPLAQTLGIRSGQLDRSSVGDEANRGLSRRDLESFVAQCGADLVLVKPKYYLAGLLYQATEAAYRLLPGSLNPKLSIRQWEMETLTWCDHLIKHLPGIREYPFFWSAIGRKR